VDGLIHISQISEPPHRHAGEVLTVGDVVDAKITAVGRGEAQGLPQHRALSEPKPSRPRGGAGGSGSAGEEDALRLHGLRDRREQRAIVPEEAGENAD
jgi:predicted RNA-binding protein with RPS1 domain